MSCDLSTSRNKAADADSCRFLIFALSNVLPVVFHLKTTTFGPQNASRYDLDRIHDSTTPHALRQNHQFSKHFSISKSQNHLFTYLPHRPCFDFVRLFSLKERTEDVALDRAIWWMLSQKVGLEEVEDFRLIGAGDPHSLSCIFCWRPNRGELLRRD